MKVIILCPYCREESKVSYKVFEQVVCPLCGKTILIKIGSTAQSSKSSVISTPKFSAARKKKLCITLFVVVIVLVSALGLTWGGYIASVLGYPAPSTKRQDQLPAINEIK
jgi:hypothetical protein